MYISLHNQTHYSILDALSSPEDLLDKAVSLGMTSIAITDHGTFASVWESFKLSKKKKIKLIVGCEYFFKRDPNQNHFNHIILLAKNAEGYKNMLSLNFDAFSNSPIGSKKKYPVVSWELLEKYSAGTICLTACGAGILAESIMESKPDQLEEDLAKLIKIFGKDNLGIEIQANNLKRFAGHVTKEIDQNLINRQLIKLADKHELRIIPSCNSHYVNKEDHDIHDTQLAIGSGQPKSSRFRLKYDLPEFYLKSEEEIKKFFSRNFGKEFADKIVDNTNYFAEMCEVPEWIDPKFSNAGGKELPVFPVKDQEDYNEFKTWINKGVSEYILSLDEDKQYLRYKCELRFDQLKCKIPQDEHQIYIDRINEELETLEYHGFSSYMLIVADYLEWAVKSGIPIGPGRGCVSSRTKVLTNKGFKEIIEIQAGDEVFSHSGEIKKVLRTFNFDINNEKLIEIKSNMSFGTITATKDHKFLGRDKYSKNLNDLDWIKAEDLTTEDYLWMTYPSKPIDLSAYNSEIDLAPFSSYGIVDDEYITYFANTVNDLSVNSIAKAVNVDGQLVSKLKVNNTSKFKNSSKEKIKLVEQYLKEKNLTLQEWQDLETRSVSKVKRKLKLDEEFYYLVGLWVGDGFLIDDKKHYKFGIGLSSHENESDTMNKIKNYLERCGFSTSLYKKKNEKALQLECRNEIILKLFQAIIPDYKKSSKTKHLPIGFRNLNENSLKKLLAGLFDADGHASKSAKKELFSTTSKRLASEIKEAFLYLQHPSAIKTNKAYVGIDNSPRTEAYVINFPAYFDQTRTKNKSRYLDNGYFCKVTELKEVSLDKVYDIEVEDDHSYITTNYVSHNSVGGCYVGYLLDIHKADSIKYDLIFERFQNKLKQSFPDCDCDVSTDFRGLVLDYLKNKYQSDHFCSISNINTITPKVYLRDLARSFEFGGSKDSAVQIGNDLSTTVTASLGKDPSIQDMFEESPLLEEYAKSKYPEISTHAKLVGKPRALGQHAAAAIISARSLVGLVPLKYDKDDRVVIEYDKDVSEENGFVKMDILGLSTLDTIVSVIDLIKKSGKPFNNEHLDIEANDEKAYELITRGDTYGVFQLGTSGGTIDLCKKVKPKNIEDLAIITTLARPAARDVRTDFILTREGKKKFSIIHPSVNNAFKKTYGFGLFDESILQLGRDVAGWNLNDADRIRKMIKEKGKNPKKDKELSLEFIESAVKNGIDRVMAERIWNEEVSKFQGYTFNKSHAILYSMVSYQQAYLKAHFPLEFLVANLMSEIGSNAPNAEGNITTVKSEIRALGVKILPPSLNKSQLTYTILDKDNIISGFDAMKFVGDDAIQDIISKRPFQSFQDFMIRVDSKKVRANAIQALAASGVFSEFGLTRKQICGYVSDYRKKLTTWLKKHDPNKETFVYPWKDNSEWSAIDIYALENKFMGESFSVSNKVAFKELAKIPHSNIKQVDGAENKTKIGSMSGLFSKVFEITIKKEGKLQGKKMYKFNFEDFNGASCSITVFPDNAEKMFKWLKAKTKKTEIPDIFGMTFSATANYYNEQFGLVLSDIYGLELPPALPEDFKVKKDVKASEITTQSLSEIEEELFEEGIILH